MGEVLGDREAVVARELTKVHEEVLRGGLEELATRAEEDPLRGEIVVLVAGRDGGRRGEGGPGRPGPPGIPGDPEPGFPPG